MKYRTLPNSDLQLSAVGFGLWTVTTGWWGIEDDRLAIDLLRRAYDLGVTFFDTADTYGNGKAGVYREKTMPVGSFPANAWGLHDMHGNIWQWCQDGYDAKFYERKVRDDPLAPPGGVLRVTRGGCFM